MAGILIYSPILAFAFGIIGNIISFMVYLAPIPTFYRIYKKKTTEGFQSVPYVVALFSAMLWIYYAMVKPRADLILITINAVGCVIETAYVLMFLIYATRQAKMTTVKLLLFLNVALFGLIVSLTLLLWHNADRVRVLGWICVGFSVSVFAAPLSIMRRVVRTKSVEYMPLQLSLFLTFSAVVWFGYGFFSADKYIAMPNVLGFAFGVSQVVLYLCYRSRPNADARCQERDPENPPSATLNVEYPNNINDTNHTDAAHNYMLSEYRVQPRALILGVVRRVGCEYCTNPNIYPVAEEDGSGCDDDGNCRCCHCHCLEAPHHDGVAGEKGSPEIDLEIELSRRITSDVTDQEASGGDGCHAAASSV